MKKITVFLVLLSSLAIVLSTVAASWEYIKDTPDISGNTNEQTIFQAGPTPGGGDEVPAASPSQEIDRITNQGWSMPMDQDSVPGFTPAQVEDSTTNQGWSLPDVRELNPDATPVPPGIDPITNQGADIPAPPKKENTLLAFLEYTNLSAFTTAAGGGLTTITFQEVPLGTTVTTQYLGVRARFTDGNDVVESNSGFVTDNVGLRGNGRVGIGLTEPAIAIGADYPGAMTIDLYDYQGGTLLYTSSNFGGSGTGFFGGVVTDTPFTYVVLRDWVDDQIFLDNIHIKDIAHFSDYTNRAAFTAAAGGGLTTITFQEVPLGTTVTTQYLGVRAQFTDGNDIVESSLNYVTDNVGLRGNGRVGIGLTEPAIAIGADYPGAMTIDLYDHQGGSLLYTSSNFGGSGTGFFGGVITNIPFTYVVLRDWVDDQIFLDNIYLKDVAGFSDYRNLAAFKAAGGGGLTTITFQEVPPGTMVTTQYLYVRARFTDGNDMVESSTAFVTDGRGLNGNRRVGIRLTDPAIAIGVDYPGAVTIELYDHQGGSLLYKSSDFGGAGTGFFGGVVTNTPFSYVVLRDWVDDFVYVDNIQIRFLKQRAFMPDLLK